MGSTISDARFRIVFVAGLLSILLAFAAPAAKAEPVTVTGDETRLEVNIINFVKLLSDGIFISAIPPARLEFGSQPAAIFPITGGVFDSDNSLSAVTHGGGLHIAKDSIGQSLDVTNIVLQCTSVTGCRLLGTANQVLPNEVAEVADVVISDDQAGTITFTGTALVSQAAALALNTIFQTTVFEAGMELGVLRSTITYDVTVDPDAYVRPAGATPVRVSLVPSYQQCTDANRVHGSPLDSPSCSPPAPASPNVTVGTFEANGAPTKSVAFARFAARAGDPGTPAVDEADVAVRVRATDIRASGDLTDYGGELQAQVNLRITDRNSTVLAPIFPYDQRATVQDTPLSVTVPCSTTADTTVGSTCSITTTADTLVPGTVLEGKRSVWGLDRVTLLDGGADGDAETAGDNAVFATQGVFVP
jgi:hypothetical protein